jgi:hypothetical protein
MGEGGYVREFVTDVCKPLLKDLVAKKIRVVTNAGGKCHLRFDSIWNWSSSHCDQITYLKFSVRYEP